MLFSFLFFNNSINPLNVKNVCRKTTIPKAMELLKKQQMPATIYMDVASLARFIIVL